MVILVTLIWAGGTSSAVLESILTKQDYWMERARILVEEENRALGGDLKFEGNELVASNVLVDAKQQEIDDGLFIDC